MSFRVLVIPEDPLQNGHILKPLVQAIMQDTDKPAAKVKLLTKPRVRGYGQAVNAIRNELSGIYRFMDLWVFFPDADRMTIRMRNIRRQSGGRPLSTTGVSSANGTSSSVAARSRWAATCRS